MITMRIVYVLDVKKVVDELSCSFVKVGPPQADNNSSNPSEIFHNNVILDKFLLEVYYIYDIPYT